jgi:hypothetical protein
VYSLWPSDACRLTVMSGGRSTKGWHVAARVRLTRGGKSTKARKQSTRSASIRTGNRGHHGGVMEWVFRKSIVPGGTGGFIQLQLDIGGELREKYQVGSEWTDGSVLTLEQIARNHFRIPPRDTIRIIEA